ncbi:acetoin utilization protein AcuC [Desulfuromonas versatilis]|uniref:Acetoin utilization protein AcuC n=1 Tax=Desulfuromonas versatilis TaxID=2802975 RepID=A0ABN6DY70_9BACT|nr:acetoin utilization protein AcuC [Desulfuromonas versatilis]BCR04960.1 acetoin utilization protein AcuC [Desulfuromonas versatilis]
MSERFAFIYSSRFDGYSYGSEHPFKVQRYRLTYELIRELGLLDGSGIEMVETPQAPEAAPGCFHRQSYLDTLKEFSREDHPRANFIYGLGDVENPVFKGMYEWSLLSCGGTMEAVRQVVDGGCRAAFSMAGGHHHAHAARASGFSYLNDAVIAIQGLLERGLRVAYVDIDAHHGDGVQEAFYRSDRVLTISLHESGRDFFPHTGFCNELGEGRGYGYSVNVPFRRHADDLIFEQAFRRIVLPLLEAFSPDVLVTQMGVDTLRSDPLSRLEFTTGAIEFATRAFLTTGLPWAAIGGGGYDKCNVARCWALLWSVMTGQAVPERLPPGFCAAARALGFAGELLRDPPRLARPDDYASAQEALERNLAFLERKLFPLHGISGRVAL